MAGDDDDDGDDDEEKRMASARDCGRRHDCRRSRREVLFIIRARSFVDVGTSSTGTCTCRHSLSTSARRTLLVIPKKKT